jgi:hypothetical protein
MAKAIKKFNEIIMIVLITEWDYPRDANGFPTKTEKECYVSHAVDFETGQAVVICLDTLEYYIRNGAKYHDKLGEWVLYDKES